MFNVEHISRTTCFLTRYANRHPCGCGMEQIGPDGTAERCDFKENMEFPRWMYHKEAPKGVLFLSQKELDNACEGWVDSPAFLHSVPDATGSTEDIESIFDRAQKEKERGEIHDLEEIEKPVPVKRGPGRPRKVTDANLHTA